MTALPTNVAPHAGLRVDSLLTASAAAPGGDDCATGVGVYLLVRNTGGVARTLTLATPQVVDGDLAVADRPFTIAATTGIHVIPVPDLYRNPSTGRAAITYDDATGLQIIAVRVP
ncbi:hypothetical protein E1264_11775 [Actinomadura sp. KC216]|uniref:hypothetical protein n=1 Tax=Actinomadura sp. KC216 TaxID=2530370 RepID=UPI001046D9F2|nr:hypothetical protein [Actinomadura sp. KC216]TDB88354.1 hypothetical protein E1264_11775 [Actinomadura sp. KC216]